MYTQLQTEEIYASDYMTDPSASLDAPNTNAGSRAHEVATMDGYVSGGDLGHPSHIQPAQLSLTHAEHSQQQQQQIGDHFRSTGGSNKGAFAQAMAAQRARSAEAALKLQQQNNSIRNMNWPSFQRHPNMYSPPHFSFDSDHPSQNSMPAIFGDPPSINYVGLQHGLPDTMDTGGWDQSPVTGAAHSGTAGMVAPALVAGMAIGGGSSSTARSFPSYGDNGSFGMGTMAHQGAGVSPATVAAAYSSSAPSGGASEAMASMSLDTPMGNTHHHMMTSSVSVGASAAATMAEPGFSMAAHNGVPGLDTVSPKVLCINSSPAPLSSEPAPPPALSNTGIFFAGGDGGSGGGDFSAMMQNQQQQQQQVALAAVPRVSTGTVRLNAKGRRELPDKPRSSRHSGNAYSPTSYSKASSSSSKTGRSHGKHHPEQIMRAVDTPRNTKEEKQKQKQKHAIDATPPSSSPAARALADLKPKPARRALPTAPSSSASAAASSGADASGAMGTTAAERREKDQFLVEAKRAGMTYREIRRKGGFAEAESTLRGRYRALTKNKEARVRKPEWTEKDVSASMFLSRHNLLSCNPCTIWVIPCLCASALSLP
jgi:hypothetical protein